MATEEFLAKLRGGFQMQGFDAHAAGLKSLAVLYREVQQQASLLSFLEAFKILGILFLVIVPLAFLMRRPMAKKS